MDCTIISTPHMNSEGPRLEVCPLCAHHELTYQFFHDGTPIVRCASCSLMMRNPQPSDSHLASIYNEHYFLGSDDATPGIGEETHRLKRDTAAGYLDAIERRLQLN